MQSVSARQRATGPVHRRHMFTRRVTRELKKCLTRAQNNKKKTWGKKKKNRVDGIYFLECVVKAFSMQRTMQEPEQLVELCCRRWPLCSDDARPVTARSPARHVSQQWSVCRWPLLLDPCQTIFSGLEEKTETSTEVRIYVKAYTKSYMLAHRLLRLMGLLNNQNDAQLTKTHHALSLSMSLPSKEQIGTFSLILLALSPNIASQLLNNTWSCKEENIMP